MMLSNFSDIVQNLSLVKEKNDIIAQCVSVIKLNGVDGEVETPKNGGFGTAKEFYRSTMVKSKIQMEEQEK
jgi:hypothetical protein